ncbi:unnamed protein product (mitochondrion) [Musa textilis]
MKQLTDMKQWCITGRVQVIEFHKPNPLSNLLILFLFAYLEKSLGYVIQVKFQMNV